MTPYPIPDRTGEQVIGGHRVLRLLARGARSRVWLAVGERVLKVIDAPLEPDQPAREVEALHRARGEHVVELFDISVDDERAALVFPRLPRGSLADLLAARTGLDAGEAVTVLAPLAAALARMHEAGVAHGALSPSTVLFRADAAPMLCGFGQAQLFEPGLPEVQREKQPGVVADRAALAALAAEVLQRVTGPRSAAAAALAVTLAPGAPQLDLETRLARQLFELAAARPVVTERGDDVEAPVRAVGVTAVTEPEPPATPAISGVTALLGGVLESGPGVLLRRRAREVWSGWSPARRKLAIGGVAGAVVLIAAVAVVPAPAADEPPPVADQAADAPAVAETPTAVTGDDPLAALTALLERREACFRDLSVLCLDDVAEAGSAALDADRAALDAVLDAGVPPQPISGVGATIVERLGDSVLISLAPDSDPASVLLLKGEAGWRIRDYLSG